MQIGTPQAVYRSPSHRFVAEFVGTNNILSGTAQSTNAGVLSLQTELGGFRVQPSAGQSVAEGASCSFVIGADHILLTSEAEALENCIPCSLISEQFVGSVVTLYFETASGVEFRVQKQQRELDALNLQIGETVWASWETQHAYLLPEV